MYLYTDANLIHFLRKMQNFAFPQKIVFFFKKENKGKKLDKKNRQQINLYL